MTMRRLPQTMITCFLAKQLRETCSILLRPKLYQILRRLLLRFSRNYDETGHEPTRTNYTLISGKVSI